MLFLFLLFSFIPEECTRIRFVNLFPGDNSGVELILTSGKQINSLPPFGEQSDSYHSGSTNEKESSKDTTGGDYSNLEKTVGSYSATSESAS
jgi:hypothetical protein